MAQPRTERRATRRFSLQLPVAIKKPTDSSAELATRTHDISARGICFYIDEPVTEGAALEFTMTLPPEITLTESIRVHCKGKVVRVDENTSEGKVAVAAVIDEYEFLADS